MNDISDAVRGARAYLAANPSEARYTDNAAVASLVEGLRVSVTDAAGQTVATDMPRGIGGSATAPSPGWLFRAATASCVATLIAITAAERGVALTSLSVTIDSESDDRGILGMDPDVPAGPLSVRCQVDATAEGVDGSDLGAIVQYAVDHCPVTDAIRRAVVLEVHA